MGAERTSQNGQFKRYVNVFKGKFEMRAEALDSEKPWIVERTTKNGTKLVVDQFEALSGDLVWVDYVPESKVGKRLHIKISEGKQLFVVDIPYISEKGWVSTYAQQLLLKLGNIDLDKEIKLIPYSFIPKGEERNKEGWTIWQSNEKIGMFEDVTAIPKSTVKEAFDGSKTYDPMDQTKYYHELMKKWSVTLQEFMSGKTTSQSNLESMAKDIDYESQVGMKSGEEDMSKVPVYEPGTLDFDDEETDDDLPF